MGKAVHTATTITAFVVAVAAGASQPPQPATSADVQSEISDGATGYAPGGQIVSGPPVPVLVSETAVNGVRRAERAGVALVSGRDRAGVTLASRQVTADSDNGASDHNAQTSSGQVRVRYG